MQRLLPCVILLLAAAAFATETEHLGIKILPAPGPVKVDGQFADWDLSAGIFACGDVETQRERFATWFHAMYDAENLYLLARFVDPTPMNNPGAAAGDMGFQGDCLQVRIITNPDTPSERGAHLTAWRDREGADLIDLVWGRKFDGGSIKDAKKQGAQQAFSRNADGSGYVQEIAIPWKLLTKSGEPLKAGDSMVITIEPNFTVGTAGRLTVKDIFKPGKTIDRVFTFMSSPVWGIGTLETRGNVEPRPVRLSDGREFAVRMEKGIPAIDWTGLIKKNELVGFKPIEFEMPEDGYISLHLRNADGQVVRQLLNCEFWTKGKHTVQWDGLTTPSWRRPGESAPAGSYTVEAIWHKGIGLRLKGWACNAGSAPWDGATGRENWGGDHGVPSAAAADKDHVYLGWTAAEAGKGIVAVDHDGNVQWKVTRGGIGGASLVAVDGNVVFALNAVPKEKTLYRMAAATGTYVPWEGSDSTDLDIKTLFPDAANAPEQPDGMTAGNGKLCLSFAKANTLLILNSATGKVESRLEVKSPGDLKLGPDGKLYVLSDSSTLLRLDPQPQAIVSGLTNASALAIDKMGQIYVGVRDPDQQIKVFSPNGKPLSTIGRKGGRAKLGKWTRDGLLNISGLAIDANGQLWATEADGAPKRISLWNPKTGQLVKEFFGPSSYGALGGAISPADPNIMVGQGCEWRLDPRTGRATCTGVITRDGMEVSRFATGANGKLYLAVAAGWAFNAAPVRIFERVADADYRLRAAFRYEGKDKTARTIFWADENGDGQEQPNELSEAPGHVRVSGWFMPLNSDLTFYTAAGALKPTAFTSCNAPRYDLAHPAPLPRVPFDPVGRLGSADGKFLLADGPYGVDHGQFQCFDIASSKLLWSYPDNFVGVHGSHNSPGPRPGMISGSFGPVGCAKLPDPIGNIWIIATNIGEWHLFNDKGFYISRIFQGDSVKVQWPEKADPGAILDNVPPGMGGEDFGGSMTLASDGNLYVQAGKTAFWNVQVIGLETIKPLPTTTVRITPDEIPQAIALREQALQSTVGRQQWTIRKGTPKFTGDLNRDFRGAQVLEFKKQDDAAIRAAGAWDDQNLYLAWEVRDSTPWKNAATDPAMMYLSGDTVDFQLATNPIADPKRSEAAAGDLRLSIGDLNGKSVAVIYRKVAAEKHPRTFSSGVVKDYLMDSVVELSDLQLRGRKSDRDYTIEAAIPLSTLGIAPHDGLVLKGDIGATHSDPAGQRTRLRTYWNNQHTGIVDDAVFELQMEPKNWGVIEFKTP